MKRVEPQNLFELEGLEPRLLLSGDALLAVVPVSISDGPADLSPGSDLPESEIHEVVEFSEENTVFNQS